MIVLQANNTRQYFLLSFLYRFPHTRAHNVGSLRKYRAIGVSGAGTAAITWASGF